MAEKPTFGGSCYYPMSKFAKDEYNKTRSRGPTPEEVKTAKEKLDEVGYKAWMFISGLK